MWKWVDDEMILSDHVLKHCPILWSLTDLVSSQVSDLDDLHSELDEQSLQDHTLVLPVLLAHGLLPLCHTFLENTPEHTQGLLVCVMVLLSCGKH